MRAGGAITPVVLQRYHVPGITAVELTGVSQQVRGREALLQLAVCSCEGNYRVFPLIPVLVDEILEISLGEAQPVGNLVKRCHQIILNRWAIYPRKFGHIKVLNQNSTKVPITGRPDASSY